MTKMFHTFCTRACSLFQRPASVSHAGVGACSTPRMSPSSQLPSNVVCASDIQGNHVCSILFYSVSRYSTLRNDLLIVDSLKLYINQISAFLVFRLSR